MSGRAIAREFGISRDSVAKMLAYSEPPGYQRSVPIKRPKLDGFTDQIDQWLADDKSHPRKQRHTARRIFDRLRGECGFTGGYTIVKDYVRIKKRGGKEMFVPLSHPPGHAQADFGEALVIIGGIEQKAYYFAFDLPHSDTGYVRAYLKRSSGIHLPDISGDLGGCYHFYVTSSSKIYSYLAQALVFDAERAFLPDRTDIRRQRRQI